MSTFELLWYGSWAFLGLLFLFLIVRILWHIGSWFRDKR